MDRIFPKNLVKIRDDPKGLIQIFIGPRQVGKTTAAQNLFDTKTTHYASADLPAPPDHEFIINNWRQASALESPARTLVMDEIQKIPRWSEVVKMLWDEDKRKKFLMRVCLLGSSAILIEKGLAESLAGRFEMNYFPHWTFAECAEAFKATLADYVWMGGYPKAYDFKNDTERLENYIQNSIVEPALGRDILSLHAVDKPALLRQLFWYTSRLPSQIVSFQKILDHLQGHGNVATLVHYAELLEQAFLLCPLQKFSAKAHRTKKSLPKWIFPNPALVDAAIRKEGLKNFTFENLVGSHLLNLIYGKTKWAITYWREKDDEIDFVVTHQNEAVLAIEVKSGRKRPQDLSGLLTKAAIPKCPWLVVTLQNAEEFFQRRSIEDVIALDALS